MLEFGAVSHLTAALVFAMLAVLTARRYLRRRTDQALLAAAVLTLLWATSLVTQHALGWPPAAGRALTELARDVAWIAVLFALIKDARQNEPIASWLKWIIGGLVVVIATGLAAAALADLLTGQPLLSARALMFGQLALALTGLSLVEQIWRNSASYGRSSIRYLCFAIAGIFVYDFFLYADALLFNQLSQALWDARGGVNALLAPLLAVNLINARTQPLQLQLSRTLVFHAGSLALAGLYLLVIAVGGYYVRLVGGTWGEGLQILFLSLFVLIFALTLSSTRFRARLMMFISQNFFDYKYDYREEWLKLTAAFSNLDEGPPLPERAIRVVASLVESKQGALWLRNDDNQLELRSTVGLSMPRLTRIEDDTELVRFMEEREWIVDLQEYRENPVRYNLLEIPDAILKARDGWLIVPLYLGDALYGLVLIGRPYARVNLNWENYDLIKVVSRQICTLLAQADTQDRLSRAMQFEAVSKASAYMVHDLKTLIAQLSLLVRNAPRHRENPAFIDDMIRTTDHAVQKMSNLVEHIRRPNQNETRTEIDLAAIVHDAVQEQSRAHPLPQLLEMPDNPVPVIADSQQLRNVVIHLIRNAQEATHKNGDVMITLKTSQNQAVLFVQDTGAGMTDEFIRHQLFKPFESTKGLTGMGIGAYQAQEYVKQLGGTLDVTSQPGVGSCFTIHLPLAAAAGSPTESASTGKIVSNLSRL